jgi:type IV pilus assembly protein PilB
MIGALKDKILKILIDTKRIKQSDLDRILEKQKKKQVGISAILVEEGLISEKDLMLIMSQELSVPPITLSKYKVDQTIIHLIPEKVARQFSLIPISKIGNVLTVAMSDPLNIIAMDEVKLLTSYKIDPVIATENDVKEAINAYYGTKTVEVPEMTDTETGMDEDLQIVEEERFDIDELSTESRKAPIVKIVDLILSEAMKKRASDIHIEACETYVKIRYRVDGTLQEMFKLPKKNQNAIFARVKIMSQLDITETRLPQDGRFQIYFEGREIDFRVSVLPVAFGPKVVLRALDKTNLSIGLDRLGFSAHALGKFKEALKRPYGMILVTGPTGSGKSTTLYSIVNQLNTTERNIMTLEDPVEYAIEGITQVEARSEIGLTFAVGLRSILRQSPDVIMVGEIRDFETADIAIKAALIGQLILSTLHTNDSVGAITRLIDMKVEPFLLASSLVMVGAQRLLRKVCPNCKTEVEVSDNMLREFGLDPKEIRKKKAKFYSGTGCDRCNNTGYYGRIGIFEAFLIDDAVRNMIVTRATSDELRSYAIAHGMKTLRQEALENFIADVTTLEEVVRVTAEA